MQEFRWHFLFSSLWLRRNIYIAFVLNKYFRISHIYQQIFQIYDTYIFYSLLILWLYKWLQTDTARFRPRAVARAVSG